MKSENAQYLTSIRIKRERLVYPYLRAYALHEVYSDNCTCLRTTRVKKYRRNEINAVERNNIMTRQLIL